MPSYHMQQCGDKAVCHQLIHDLLLDTKQFRRSIYMHRHVLRVGPSLGEPAWNVLFEHLDCGKTKWISAPKKNFSINQRLKEVAPLLHVQRQNFNTCASVICGLPSVRAVVLQQYDRRTSFCRFDRLHQKSHFYGRKPYVILPSQ